MSGGVAGAALKSVEVRSQAPVLTPEDIAATLARETDTPAAVDRGEGPSSPPVSVMTQEDIDAVRERETDHPAPIDRGVAPTRLRRGVASLQDTLRERELARDHSSPVDNGDAPQVDPVPGAEASSAGIWSAAMSWPINAIHAVLTPDGKVLSYGTDPNGVQGAQRYYDVWDPTTRAHNLVQHARGTDLFCSAHSVLAESGQVLIAGGDTRGVAGSAPERYNLGVRDVTLFDPATATLLSAPPMNRARWCGSVVPLADGRVLALGGIDALFGAPSGPPEIYAPGLGWTELPGIDYGDALSPRAMLAPNGRIVVATDNRLLSFNTSSPDTALIGMLPKTIDWVLPWAMFDRGKVLMIANDGGSMVIDLNGTTPAVMALPGPAPDRDWGSATVLPDGKVLVTGGSAPTNDAAGAVRSAVLWDPKTMKWTVGASASKPRLFQSTALLLPDATVLSAGGGSPGPMVNLNAEIYSPPYLFDGSGQRLPRPVINEVPAQLILGADFRIAVAHSLPIQRVTLVRTGSVTRSSNFEQRFLELPFTQAAGDANIDVGFSESPNVLPPGHYMLFVIDSAGAPSVARILKLGGGWSAVAQQGQSFVVPSATLVQFGAGDSMVEKTVSGAVHCSNEFFGKNPAPNAAKACSVLTPKRSAVTSGRPTRPTVDKTVAVEGDAFDLSMPTLVSYGAGSQWTEKIVSGPATCSNEFFGVDPLRFVVKTCVVSGPRRDRQWRNH